VSQVGPARMEGDVTVPSTMVARSNVVALPGSCFFLVLDRMLGQPVVDAGLPRPRICTALPWETRVRIRSVAGRATAGAKKRCRTWIKLAEGARGS